MLWVQRPPWCLAGKHSSKWTYRSESSLALPLSFGSCSKESVPTVHSVPGCPHKLKVPSLEHFAWRDFC